jgi:hypothetical protein
MFETFLTAKEFGFALAGPAVRLARKASKRSGVPVRVRPSAAGCNRHLFAFSRHRAKLHLSISADSLRHDPGSAIARISAMSAVLGQCAEGARGIAEFSDGEHCGDGIVSMCANHPGSLLMPDNEFIASKAYEKLRQLAQDVPAFEARQDLLLWRGSTTGKHGAISLPDMTATTSGLLPRTRMCLLLKDVPGCDARVHDVVQSNDILSDVRRLAAAGILGHYIDTLQWQDARFHVGIDGNTLAWSSTFTRLLLGCCVIKPEDQTSYRQWYTPRCKPWVHYVPTPADLSGLLDTIEWCRANVTEAARIAANGRALALGMAWRDEIEAAARSIDDACSQNKLIPADPVAQALLAEVP